MAYFDESGTQSSSPVITVGGFVATYFHWQRFGHRWAELLRDLNVSTFHMTDFESGYGEFKDCTREKRIGAIRRVHSLIGRTALFGVTASVPKAEYERHIDGTAYEKMVGRPYVLAAKLAVYEASRQAREHNWVHHPIEYVFEQGAEGQGALEAWFRATHTDQTRKADVLLGSWRFGEKREAPLQVADLNAYEAWKEMVNGQLVDEVRRLPVRQSMNNLFASTPLIGNYLYDHSFEVLKRELDAGKYL